MVRPRKQPGDLSGASVKEYRGRWRARVVIRDGAGERHEIVVYGEDEAAARRAMETRAKKIWSGLFAARTEHKLFRDLAEAWRTHRRASVGKEKSIVATTMEQYEYSLDNILLPLMGAVPLTMIDAQFCNRLYTELELVSFSRAKRGRQVLSMICAYGVDNGSMAHNPVRSSRALEGGPSSTKMAYDEAQMVALVTLVRGFRGRNPERKGGGRPDIRMLEDVILVCLGTSCRPGEALAIRRQDVRLGSTPALVEICGTIKRDKVHGLHRQEKPKREGQKRFIPVPRVHPCRT